LKEDLKSKEEDQEDIMDSLEKIEEFAIVIDSELENGLKDRGKKDILFRSYEDEYFLGRGGGLINNGFHNLWSLYEDEDAEINEYNNLAKGVVEETGSKINDVKILLDPSEERKVTKFNLENKEDIFKDYKTTGKSLLVPVLYAFLSGGSVEIDEELWKTRPEMEKNKKFELFKPENFKFTGMDKQIEATRADIDEDEYKKGKFSGYYQGLIGKKDETPQNFACFEVDGKKLYEPFMIPDNAEMLRKEFRKRMGDNTVDRDELERTRILNEFSMPIELLERADMDMDFYLQVSKNEDPRRSYTLKKGEDDEEIGKMIRPHDGERAFIEVGEGKYEFPSGMINLYVPRIKEELKITGFDDQENGNMMYA